MTERDVWARWLLERRFGDDAANRDRSLEFLIPIRDRLLDGAALQPDDVVLDVGAGDGLIGLGALERLGPSRGQVILSDVSEDLLAASREVAAQLGVEHRCRFFRAPRPPAEG